MDISVIIPTLDEAPRIAALIERTRGLGNCEIIVVDGGSRDGTFANAAAADVYLTSTPGRGAQLNLGAEASHGAVLLFLHADCRLDPGSFEAVRSALSDSSCVGGCFRQRIDAVGLRYRMLEWGNAQRVKWWQWAYGDQGVFVRREVFEEVGGFPDVKLMEDVWLMKRLKRLGRIVLVDARIHTSARRWKHTGVIRQTLRNWSLLALAHCGVSPDRLARFYPSVR